MDSDIFFSADSLSRHFAGVKALDDFSIQVHQGSIHSIIGPNGSGKTTFFNVVAGLLTPTRGRLSLNGKDITSMKAHLRTRKGIARTFQIPRVLPDMTCLENVLLGSHARTRTDIRGTFLRRPFTVSRQEHEIYEDALSLLEFVGLGTTVDKLGENLSWTEEQMLQLARALAAKPRLLMLDEPTAGMGTTESEKMKNLIRRINNQKVTILLVAHDNRLVLGISDQVTVMHYGKKLTEGTPEEIRTNPKVVEAYLGKA